MDSISSIRLTIPKRAGGEIVRHKLIDTVWYSKKEIIYIHAGAGYGKTTLLSQLANLSEHAVWLTLAGENDLFTFVDALCKSIRHGFPDYNFSITEYLPFADQKNFITVVANALIVSIEKLNQDFMLIIDDLHTIQDVQLKTLICGFLKYSPVNAQVLLSGREPIWQELLPLYLKGKILEVGQSDLTFTRDEIVQMLGVDDDAIFRITEGWPLAVGSFRVLMENGVAPSDVSDMGKDMLYSYLFYECCSRISPEMTQFLKDSACFEDLDALMLGEILNKKNTKLMLESLVSRNIFTIRTADGHYRYHALFRESLLEDVDVMQINTLQQKAAWYYFNQKDFSKAAEYAMKSDDKGMLQEIILASYKIHMVSGDFNELRLWFQTLGDCIFEPEILVAKGAFLSHTGNFTGAKKCLDAAIPLLNWHKQALYYEAMVHKARVLRNFDSFEESNKLLDLLLSKHHNPACAVGYSIAIEKLYNLCWTSQIDEAYELVSHAVTECARAGNMQIKAWYERYLSAVHFFAGRMKDTVYYYEKSLEIPENEQQYLELHGIGIYAAKAYQMLGNRTRAHSILSDELKNMRCKGKYEEMWSGYLFAAEIYFQDASIDRVNGLDVTYETTMKYFTLADEYAPLYRKTDFQMRWAKMQRLTYSLMFAGSPKEEIMNELFADFDSADDYLKSIILARLFGYLAATSGYAYACKYAKMCIQIGKKSNMLLHSTLAYGMLARAAIAEGDHAEAAFNSERYLQLCYQNGIYEYFKARKDYDPILSFAKNNGIEPEITMHFIKFSGYHVKKAYIKTFGGFSVSPYEDKTNPLKITRKKKRELLAFLLDAGESGVTKEQIYDAVWPESESGNVKKMIGVNLAQIKKDLSLLGIENSVVCRKKRYSVIRDEIECDFEIFENTAESFQNTRSRTDGQKLLNLYTGEYISDFEALWAMPKRIKYRDIYEAAVKCLLQNPIQ